MANHPTSRNSYITSTMLKKALYSVTLKKGPLHVQKYIKQKWGFALVLDKIRGKIVALFSNTDIIMEIDFKDIKRAICLDENLTKEHRHRVEIETNQGEVYLFYVDNPYLWDPMHFLNQLNYIIDCREKPQNHKRDKAKIFLILFLFVLVFSAISVLVAEI